MVGGKPSFDKAAVLKVLEQVEDPEVPVLTIADLGILRDVEIADENITAIITPTYSGCPAILSY